MDTRERLNPFPGLRPFSKDEADLFFGRDKQSDELVRRLAGRRFLAVVGTSGSGKSSLVRAGLIPSLESGFASRAGTHWRTAIVRPQDDPIGFLAEGLVESGLLTHADLSPAASRTIVETTLRRSSLGLVESVRLGRLEPHENLLVVVDQFEELFRFADLAGRGEAVDEAPAFVKLLLEATMQGDVAIYVVLTMRSDFLGDCARFRNLPEAISDSQYLIPRLTRDELQAAITGPIGVRGGAIAPAIVQHLLNAVGDDMDQLPVLQHALMRAWDHWEAHDASGSPIELEDLEAIGGLAQALSRHADEAFAALTGDPDRSLAERIFKCLTDRGADNREVRRPTPVSRLSAITTAHAADLVRVIDVFRAPGRSFLVPPSDVPLDGDSVIDNAHESLIRQWQRLRGWVDEEAESRATYLRLVDAARLYEAGRGGLWGEPDLTFAKQWEQRQAPTTAWAAQYAPGFETARAFLQASEAAHAAAEDEKVRRLKAEREQRDRELAQAQALAEAEGQRAAEQVRQAVRLRKMLLLAGTAGLVAVLLAAAAIVLFLNMRRARDTSVVQGLIADALRLSAVSTTLGPQSNRALLLASEGMLAAESVTDRNVRVPAAEQALRDMLRGSSGIGLRFLPGEGNPIVVSADSHWLAAGGRDGTGYLVDLKAPGPMPTWRLLPGHEGAMNAIAVSRDGRWLLTGGVDRTARRWDLTNAKPESTAVVFGGHRDAVTAVAISSNGAWLASGSADGTVRLWRSNTVGQGMPLELRLGAPVTALAFIGGDRWLVTASGRENNSGNVRLWDLSASDPAAHPVSLANDRLPVYEVAADASDNWLVARGDDASYLWNLHDADIAKSRGTIFSSALVSPDERWAVSVTHGGDVVLHDLKRLEGYALFLHGNARTGRDARDARFAFSHDSRWLVTYGEKDNEAWLWDFATSNLKTPAPAKVPLTGHGGPVSSAAFSADGRWLVTGSRNTLFVRDLTKPGELAAPTMLHGPEFAINQVQFSADDRWLIARGFSDLGVHLWNWQERLDAYGEPIVHVPKVPADRVDVTRDLRWFAVAEDSAIRMWDLGSRLRDNPPATFADDQTFSTLVFNHDGTRLVSGGDDGRVSVWDVGKSGGRRVLRGHTKTVRAVAISPDNRWVAAGTAVDIRVWDLAIEGGDSRATVLPNADRGAYYAAFSSDSRRLITFDGAGGAQIWDVATSPQDPTLLRKISVRPNVASIALSPESRWLAVGHHDGPIEVWDLRTTQEPSPRLLNGHQGTPVALAFTPDGRRLASAGANRLDESRVRVDDRSIRLWDLEAPDPSRSAVVFEGHDSNLSAVKVSPDGHWLATASFDGTARVWDLSAADPARTALVLNGNEGAVWGLAFAADSRSLLTWGEDATVRRWPLGSDELLARARRVTGRNLTQTEWSRYFPGKPYHRTFADLPIHSTVVEQLVRTVVATGIDDALGQLEPSLRVEGRRAIVDRLVGDASALAAKADYEGAMGTMAIARRIDPSLDAEFGKRLGRLAAGALLTDAKFSITGSYPPKVPDALEKVRKAAALDPALPAGAEQVLRDLARRRFRQLAKTAVSGGSYQSKDALDRDRSLLESAVAFDSALRTAPEVAALASRVEAGPGELAANLALADATGEWKRLLEAGDVRAAASAYASFESRFPGRILAATWNDLCWVGALKGGASVVRAACDSAVKLAPDNAEIRDSRALARALLGDRDGAIADWRIFIAADAPAARRKQRQDWVRRLEAGERFTLTTGLRRELLTQ